VLCMQPLDLLKVKFQVATAPPQAAGRFGLGAGRAIYGALQEIYTTRGAKGLYRGLGTNIVGNASSWGLYFLL